MTQDDKPTELTKPQLRILRLLATRESRQPLHVPALQVVRHPVTFAIDYAYVDDFKVDKRAVRALLRGSYLHLVDSYGGKRQQHFILTNAGKAVYEEVQHDQ